MFFLHKADFSLNINNIVRGEHLYVYTVQTKILYNNCGDYIKNHNRKQNKRVG